MRWRALALSFICGLLLSAEPALAEKRGISVAGQSPVEFFAQQTGKSYAVVIGIDDYEHVRPLKYLT